MFTFLRLSLYIFILAFCLVSIRSTAQLIPHAKTTAAQVKPNTLIFKLKPDYSSYAAAQKRQQLQEIISAIRPKIYKQKFPRATTYPNLKPGEVDLSLLYELEYEAPFTFEKIKRQLLSSGLVAYVEPVIIPQLLHQPSDPYADSIRGSQYHLKLIKAYKGWDIQKGDSNVVIGILDTGIRLNHEDLKNKIAYNYADPIDGIDNDQDGYTDNFYGWDTANNDNNPNFDSNNHGVLVSGAAAGETNNEKGIAGTGYNVKILPIKVFGSSPQANSFGGYEGIVYAAEHGCQVINISWGSPGYKSAYEQDIINYAAINHDVIIVAAAGNTATDPDYYPASYDNVLSVAISDNQDQVPYYATIGRPIDLVAPGVGIWTTHSNADNTYTYGNGSSFSSPVVAGCAALVRKQFPNYTAAQIAEQLRMTADDISGLAANANKDEKIGRGRVNLYRALTETNVIAVRNTGNLFSPGNLVYAGDTLQITGAFKNMLAPVSNLQITLTCSSPYVTVLQRNFTVGALATLAAAANGAHPFTVVISPVIPQNEVLEFRYGFSGDYYQDYQYFTITANPDYVVIDINDLHVTITSRGNIGYDGLDYTRGEGILYKNSSSLTAEGGLMVGITSEQVSDNIRNEKGESDNDFVALQSVRKESKPKVSDMAASGVMQDFFPDAAAAGVRITHRAYAWQEAPDHRYVILEYKITNTTPTPLSNLFAGLFNDWDVGIASRNLARWDTVNTLGYVYSPERPNLYAGMKLLSPLPPTHYAIQNFFSSAEHINLADGFTNAEKYAALSSATTDNQEAGTTNGADVSDVVGGRLPLLKPGESYQIAFAVLAGDNLPDLQASAKAAQEKYKQIKSGPVLLARNETICAGSQTVISPRGGTTFKFYSDAAGNQLVGSGASFTSPVLTATTTYYVSNVDSIFESTPVPITVTAEKITADFSFGSNPVTLNANKEINFSDNTRNSQEWKWYVGKQLVSTEKKPAISFSAIGKHLISLVVKSPAGCSDSLAKEIDVLPPLPIIQQTTICAGTSYLLTPTGGTNFRFYADANGTQLLFTGSVYQTPTLNENTIYYVSNFDFEKESALVPVTITAEKVETAFVYSPNPVTPAAAGVITFTDQTPAAVKWQWFMGNGTQSSEKNPIVRYTATGSYRVKLTATTANGCVDTAFQTITINYLAYNQNWKQEDFMLSPVPATENHIYLTVPENIDTRQGLQLEILNAIGAIVNKRIVNTIGEISLNLNGLPNGAYFLRISNAQSTITKRFVVLRE